MTSDNSPDVLHVARALAENRSKLNIDGRVQYSIDPARTMITSYNRFLAANGLCIVPVYPTEKMLDAGRPFTEECSAVWEAMLREGAMPSSVGEGQ